MKKIFISVYNFVCLVFGRFCSFIYEGTMFYFAFLEYNSYVAYSGPDFLGEENSDLISKKKTVEGKICEMFNDSQASKEFINKLRNEVCSLIEIWGAYGKEWKKNFPREYEAHWKVSKWCLERSLDNLKKC